MKMLGNLWNSVVAFVCEPSRYVCTVCGNHVAQAATCDSCGVTSCDTCRQEEECPYCGEAAY